MDKASSEKYQIQDAQPPDLFRRAKTLFLMNSQWWESWTRYVGYDDTEPSGPMPGPIDNSQLVEKVWTENGWGELRMKPGLQEKVDFEYLSPTSWRKLIAWYTGGLPLEVFLVEGEPDLQPIPLHVWVIETANDFNTPKDSFLVSTKITVEQLHKFMCERLSLPYHKYATRFDNTEPPLPSTPLSAIPIDPQTKVYIQMKSSPPEIRLIPCAPAPIPRKSPSSHGDTQDDSDEDLDLTSKEELRADRSEVEDRIERAMKGRKVRLEIRDLGESEKTVVALWGEFDAKDVV